MPIELVLGTANKTNPPLYLRRYIGDPSNFKGSGEEFLNYLIQIADLQPTESILDIGCGCGSVTIPLTRYLDSNKGKYVGADIYDRAIDWCNNNIASNHKNFKFLWVDVKNTIYSNKGNSAEIYRFPLANDEYNVILLKSVFTHMRPEEMNNYLHEISRLLSPRTGRCLVTFFLLNKQQKELEAQGLNQLAFSYGSSHWKYIHEKSPESACAYDEDLLLNQLLPKNNLVCQKIIYGSWTGRKDGLTFQDIVLLRRI